MSYLAEDIRAVPAPRLRENPARARRAPVLLVVEDGVKLSAALLGICEFLRISIETVGGSDDLDKALRRRRPMAVLAELDGRTQDGCYVMMRVADYDRSLPMMLLTTSSPSLIGAAEAVEGLCGLSSVTRRPVLPEVGEIVEFLFCAGRSGFCLGLLPA